MEVGDKGDSVPTKRKPKPSGYWKKIENCEKAAKECESISDFCRKYPQGYFQSKNNGWLDMWFKRIIVHGYCNTREKCEALSKQCETRTEFAKKFPGAYKNSCENGWINGFSWLKPVENIHKNGYSVYVYLFAEDNYGYVGLTCQKYGGRDWQHRNTLRSPVYRHSRESGIEIPNPKILAEHLSSEDAQLAEEFYIEWYRQHGWTMMNKAKAGGLGGAGRKYKSKKKLIRAASQCKTRGEFKRRFPGEYGAAQRFDLLDEIYSFCGIEQNHSESKSVYVWDAGYGNLIGKYDSHRQASRELGISVADIALVLCHERKSHKGYIFTETSERPKELLDRWKKVIQVDDNGNIVKVWKNSAEAFNAGFRADRAIQRRHKCKGFYFLYATEEDLEKINAGQLESKIIWERMMRHGRKR